MAFLYKKSPLLDAKVVFNVPYTSSENPKQQLDLYYPTQVNWPVMIFVYGGGWTSGDKGLRVGGKDVYGNIGRFYASRGIGVAVINYRLQPEVTWHEQVDDVAAAVAWIKGHSAEYGADSNRLFLAGHSAGGFLASFVSLNPKAFAEHSIPTNAIKGVISISGAGLDLADQESYRIGEKRSYYEQRFCHLDCPPGWDEIASPVHYITSNAPPFLILYAGGEKKSLHRQSQLLSEGLTLHGVDSKLIEIPGQSHARMVLVLTDPDKAAASAIVDFIRGNGMSIQH